MISKKVLQYLESIRVTADLILSELGVTYIIEVFKYKYLIRLYLENELIEKHTVYLPYDEWSYLLLYKLARRLERNMSYELREYLKDK